MALGTSLVFAILSYFSLAEMKESVRVENRPFLKISAIKLDADGVLTVEIVNLGKPARLIDVRYRIEEGKYKPLCFSDPEKMMTGTFSSEPVMVYSDKPFPKKLPLKASDERAKDNKPGESKGITVGTSGQATSGAKFVLYLLLLYQGTEEKYSTQYVYEVAPELWQDGNKIIVNNAHENDKPRKDWEKSRQLEYPVNTAIIRSPSGDMPQDGTDSAIGNVSATFLK